MTLRIRFLVEPAPPISPSDEAGASHSEEPPKTIDMEATPGELLTQVAYRAGVVIQQTCGGSPSCTDCRVIVKSENADCFEEMQHEERSLLGNVYFITKERLACQAHVKSSCTVWVPNPKRYRKTQRRT